MRPFEWLTDSPSMIPLIESVLPKGLPNDAKPRILHVGSGSSILGEHLVETLGDRISLVVNVDKDSETLQKMELQWHSKHTNNNDNNNNNNNNNNSDMKNKCAFETADFGLDDKSPGKKESQQQETYPISHLTGSFHLAIDKSTLDCTLCSDSATAGLLLEVYRLLHPQGGVYVVVSFHHIDLLRPLLEDLPGANWDVTHRVMNRQVEDLIGNRASKNGISTVKKTSCDGDNTLQLDNLKNSGAWERGTFEPDEQYRRTVNVMICTRKGTCDDDLSCNYLQRDAIIEHVHQTNDKWYQEHNPMLTPQRKDKIQSLFHENSSTSTSTSTSTSSSKDPMCDLNVAYTIIFNDAEKEHFTYDLFLEDWDAWTIEKNDPSFPRDKMSLATAFAFLEAMQ